MADETVVADTIATDAAASSVVSDAVETATSYWSKFVAAVKSAPAVFAYGVIVGGVVGAILF